MVSLAGHLPCMGAHDMSELLELFEDELKPFLDSNPSAKLIEKDEKPFIATPWGDESLALEIPDEPDALVVTLNDLILPDRLSAIWHKSKNALEVIWTARRLAKDDSDISGRAFKFNYKGNEHLCSFGDSSAALLTIAKSARPQALSPTAFRNLNSFHVYVTSDEKEREKSALDKPRSFWIENLPWDESAVLALLADLNFYLTYYDEETPWVKIHESSATTLNHLSRTRYIAGKFPDTIVARPLNPNLTTFYAAAKTPNPMLRFILYFRIIEYAAHGHIDIELKNKLTRLLAAPHAATELASSVEQVCDMFGGGKLDDTAKLRAVVKKALAPRLLWNEVQRNLDAFTQEPTFDGGFVLSGRLLNPTDTKESFETWGVDRFTELMRKLRNALSHGRDLEQGALITPTARNMKMLAPWANLASVAAGEVIVYKDVL